MSKSKETLYIYLRVSTSNQEKDGTSLPEQEKLATRLKQKTFADYISFQNSGAEATEAAIKIARRYFYSKGQTRKNDRI